MIPLWAVELFKKYWLHMLIALAVMAYTGFIYWEGGRGPRAELAQFQTEVAAKEEEQELEDEFNQEESANYVAQLEKDHAARIDTLNRTWDAFVAGMQPPSGPVQPPKSIPVNAGICNDAAADQRLSDAVSKYRDAVRLAISTERAADREVTRRERTGVAALLKSCQKQTGDLIEVQQWADHERNKIWDKRPDLSGPSISSPTDH